MLPLFCCAMCLEFFETGTGQKCGLLVSAVRRLSAVLPRLLFHSSCRVGGEFVCVLRCAKSGCRCQSRRGAAAREEQWTGDVARRTNKQRRPLWPRQRRKHDARQPRATNGTQLTRARYCRSGLQQRVGSAAGLRRTRRRRISLRSPSSSATALRRLFHSLRFRCLLDAQAA